MGDRDSFVWLEPLDFVVLSVSVENQDGIWELDGAIDQSLPWLQDSTLHVEDSSWGKMWRMWGWVEEAADWPEIGQNYPMGIEQLWVGKGDWSREETYGNMMGLLGLQGESQGEVGHLLALQLATELK